MSAATDTLYHYYERTRGPFRNLSCLHPAEARTVMDDIRKNARLFAAHRAEGYLERRHELEAIARDILIRKGGRPKTRYPHYMVVGDCAWLRSWYVDGAAVAVPVERFAPETLSFSYGDLFPTFSDRVNDGKEYRKQVYTLDEIRELIGRYGLPQDWNADGTLGPERYVEVQVWDEEPIREYLKAVREQGGF